MGKGWGCFEIITVESCLQSAQAKFSNANMLSIVDVGFSFCLVLII